MKVEIDNGQQTGLLMSGSIAGVGENVAQYDLLYLCGLTGKSFQVDVTDFAAVGSLSYGTAQTNSGTGQIVAQTAVAASQSNFNPGCAPSVINSDGDIFVITDSAAGVGVKLSKFSAAGSLISSVDVVTSGTSKNHSVFELSNGNIAVVYNIISGNADIYIAVYDRNLATVKAATLIASAPGTSYFSGACKLSAGGFAVIYQDQATPLQSKLTTFDNTGTVVLAATTVWTRTGSSGNQYHVMTQLSNGNLAFAISSTNTVSSIGIYYGVYTTAGAQVSAVAQLGTVSNANFPQIVAGTGFFAVARANGTDQKAWVLNNAGALQGTEFSAATTGGNPAADGYTGSRIAIVWDNTDFYLIWHRSSDSKCVLTKLPVTGTGYVTNLITIGVTQYNFFLSAFYADGFIVAATMSGGVADNVAPKMWVVDVAKAALVNPAGTTFGVVPGTANGINISLINGGDRSFIAMYTYTNTAGTNLCVGKWSATAIIGVSADNALKNGAVSIQSKPGAYKINPVKGSRFKNYDMTGSSIIGGKGAILAGGAVNIVQ